MEEYPQQHLLVENDFELQLVTRAYTIPDYSLHVTVFRHRAKNLPVCPVLPKCNYRWYDVGTKRTRILHLPNSLLFPPVKQAAA